MKNLKKVSIAVVLVALFIYCIISTISKAGSITAASCTQANVLTAINAASTGDTVIVPAGNCTWTGFTLSKGIHLKGAGSGVTNISGGFSISKNATNIIEVSDFTFSGGLPSPAGGTMNIYVTGSSAARPFVVHDCVFNLSNGQAFRVETNGGLIYRSTFNGNYANGDQAVQYKVGGDTQSWRTADTMGMKDTTGERNLYIEDSTFNKLIYQGFDLDENSRTVIRYNTFNDSSITSHGLSTGPASLRHFEIYNNTFKYPHASNDAKAPGLDYFLFLRGGTGILADNWFDNMNTQEWGNKSEVKFQEQQLRRTSSYTNCPTVYPATQQLGQGHNGTSYFTDPVYIWGNTGQPGNDGNAATASDYESDDCGKNTRMVPNFWQAGRDYVIGTPKPGYTKYTYPHPLRNGSVTPPPPPLDTTSPTISITSPLIGTTVSGMVPINATAADNVAVAGVQFILDGTNLLAEDTTAPYSVSWNTTTATNATHSLTAIARDTSNNTAVVAAVTVTVNNAVVPPPPDTTSPVVSVTAPLIGTTVKGTIPVTANASDNIGVVGVQFKVDGVNLNTEDTTTPYSTSWNTTSAINGAHSLTAIARDVANNTGAIVAVNVSVNNAVSPPPDTTSPTVSITSPLAGASLSGSVAVTANAADNIAVAGVQFKLDGVNLGAEDTSAPYSMTWNTTTATNGSHNLIAVARDTSNNTAAVTAVVVNVSNAVTPPPPSCASFAIGCRVKALQGVAARSTPSTSAAILQVHATGELGTIIGGSTVANGWTWWNINYDTGIDGWSTQAGYLGLSATTTPPPPPPSFNFTLTNGGNKSVVRGSSVTNTATATLSAGTTTPVSFSVSGLPTGATGSFSPVSCSPTCTSTLTIATTASTAVGSSTITVTATGGGVTKTSTFSLSVTGGVTPPPPTDTTAPSTPANLSAAAISSSQINLTWTASTDNVGVTGYRVERCQGATCTTFAQIGTPSTNSYSDSSLSAAAAYRYRVRATDAAGNLSSYSAIASATTQSGSVINGSYSTSFSGTENPISESGVWINGGTTGLDWANIRSTPGLAFGVNLPSQFADPTAVLTGTWSPDQQAQGTVRVGSTPSGCCHEVELRLRTTITAHSITGYEILCSLDSGNYLQIVRWNGPLNNFTYLNETATHCVNNDVLKATMVGNVITVYKNGSQVLQTTDNTFTSGRPGIGFYDNSDSNWSNFGFSNFTASNAATPPPPSFNFTLTNGGNKSVVRGSSVTNTATATLSAGTTTPVSFSVSGLPTGATGSFSPVSCSPTCTSTLTIATSASTAVGTYTATVTATGGGVTKTSTFSLSVTGTVTPPPTVTISASPASIASGSSSTLTWSSTNSTSCTASGAWTGTKAISGTQSVSPTTTSTYTLACTGTGGTATQSATVSISVAGAPPALPSGRTGIAAGYTNDAGISANPNVLFADGFETYTSPTQFNSGNYNGYYAQQNFALDTANVFSGAKSLRIRMPQSGGEVSNGLVKNISPTRDSMYMRVYTRYQPTYAGINSAHNGLRITGKYKGPGIRPDGQGNSNGFLVNIENNTQIGEGEPGNTHAYVYQPENNDVYGENWYPDGQVTNGSFNFGQYFTARPKVIPARGQWISYEVLVQLNTPGSRDGRIAVWQDGALIADWQNIRFRDVASLKIDQIELDNGGQSSTQVNDKWYDNLVIASSYIGPVSQ